jgi:hypothetical protein
MERRALRAGDLVRAPAEAGDLAGRAAPPRKSPTPESIRLRPASVTGALASVFLVLLTVHVAGLVARFWLGYPADARWIAFFDFDTEGNLPTWFSSILFIISAGLLAVLGAWKRAERDAFARHWKALAATFLFLALDEATSLHERLDDVGLLKRALSAGGGLYHPWVAVYAALVVLAAIFLFRFMGSLPRRTRTGFLVAAVLYVSGAVGMEMVGAAHDERSGREDLGYASIATFEETLEMAGALVFIFALLAYPDRAGADGRLLVRIGRYSA